MSTARACGPDDAEEILRLRAVMLSALGGGPVLPAPWQRTGADLLRRRLAAPRPDMAAFVVDRPDGTGLAACAVGAVEQRLPGPANPTGVIGYVYNVVTAQDYRRRGYSRACLQALLAWYDEQHVSIVHLTASPDGEPVYTALGFTRTGHPAMRRQAPPQ